jgi:tetratricopeptide (TPR) repeat protein
MIDNNSIIENDYNQITIGNKTYKKHIICDDIESIKKLKNEKILNPNLDNNEYIIKCENKNKYIIDPIHINNGGSNVLYNLIGQDNKVIRVCNHADEKNEIQGFFIQYYISKKCPYICKIYEFGYLIMDNKKYAYSILEKLVEPDLDRIYSNKNIKKYDYAMIKEQIFDGLTCIVSNKYTHDDINMRNIGIGEDKNVRIFDFGIAYYNNTDDNTDDNINDNICKVCMIIFETELANLYNIFGEKNKAASLCEECFDNAMRSLDNEHPDTLRNMIKLTRFYNYMVPGGKGIQMFEEYFEKSKRLRGNDHPNILSMMSDIAYLYIEVGNNDKAQSLYEECLEKMKQVRGNDHPDTLYMMINLANFYYIMRHNDEALSLYEECFEKTMQSHGNDDLNELFIMKLITNFYNYIVPGYKGIHMFEKYFEKSKQLRGNDNPHTLRVMHTLAIIYNNMGHGDKATPIFEEYDNIMRS